jgi:hypothetical protein
MGAVGVCVGRVASPCSGRSGVSLERTSESTGGSESYCEEDVVVHDAFGELSWRCGC